MNYERPWNASWKPSNKSRAAQSRIAKGREASAVDEQLASSIGAFARLGDRLPCWRSTYIDACSFLDAASLPDAAVS